MVVDDEGVSHPHAAVGDTLPEAVGAKEGVQLALPDATCVAAPGMLPTMRKTRRRPELSVWGQP